jgi:hypothetical protein
MVSAVTPAAPSVAMTPMILLMVELPVLLVPTG